MVRILVGSFFFMATLTAHAQYMNVQKILDKFEEVRPSAEDMAIYRHDWVATLKQAKDRAKKEGRPIFFIGNTNISGPTNFYSGHC